VTCRKCLAKWRVTALYMRVEAIREEGVVLFGSCSECGHAFHMVAGWDSLQWINGGKG